MDLMNRRRSMMAHKAKEPGILPDGYTQLKYIQANGKQFINTDVYITDYTDIVKATYALTSGVASEDHAISGGRQAIWWIGIGSYTRKSPYTQKPITVQYSAGGGYGSNMLADLNTFVTVEANPNTNKVVIDGVEYDYTGRWDRYEVTPALYQLFNYNSRTTGCSYLKLQYAEVVNKGIFIPCLRKADGEIGVFNITTQTFLANAGTGTFGYETMNGTYIAPV